MTLRLFISSILSNIFNIFVNLFPMLIAFSQKTSAIAMATLVMLSILHRHNEYKKKGEKRVAKFFPHFDGPFKVTKTHPEASSYTLEMPNSPNSFSSYHTSELKPHFANDPTLFPSR